MNNDLSYIFNVYNGGFYEYSLEGDSEPSDYWHFVYWTTLLGIRW